jgi:hypothetical protein
MKKSEFEKYLSRISIKRLEEFLRKEDAPCWESDLLKVLAPELNMINGSALELYRYHFVLFHYLYQLQIKLYEENLYLHVHFMGIHLLEFPSQGKCRFYFQDPPCFCNEKTEDTRTSYCLFHRSQIPENSLEHLSEKYFYLDEKNFNSISEDNAEAFVTGAWQLLFNHEDMLNCYKIMELPENSDLKLVKRHFRNLARKYHPDINPEFARKFCEINSAYRRLIGYLTVKPV